MIMIMNISSYIITLLLVILLHPFLCANNDLLEANRTNLFILDGSFIIKQFNETYLNAKDKTVQYSTTGKIWHYQSEADNIKLSSLLLINQYYMFLIESLDLLKIFTNQTLFEIIKCGVIIPNITEFHTNEADDFIQALNDSIFMHNDSTLAELIQYDIKAETGNNFFNLAHQAQFFLIPFVYIKTVSILSFLVAIGIIALWNLKIRYTPGVELYFLQKVIIFLPYLNLIVCGLMIVQMFLAKDTKTSSFSDSRIYIETALITIRAIFRTMFWFLLVLVASGWQITAHKLSKEKIKLFIKVFVFIYVVVCVDQIIDSFIGHIFVIFFPSEIKNIIFYLLMAIAICYEGRQTLRLIKTKLNYAVELTPQFIPTLLLKSKMMKYHIAFGVGYFVVFTILLIVHKVALRDFNTQDFLLLNYHTIDLILLILYLVIYKPMKTPPYFNIEFGDDEEHNLGKIYSAKIPNILDIIDKTKINVLKQGDIAQMVRDSQNENENEKVPIVVINPVAIKAEDENNVTVNIIADKLAVGFLFKQEPNSKL